ncbi:MAG: hypothetical protein CL610_24280 [Anaerolineaceae bacterium]|nr:hypothetical protein [Anaerolineaceae bacterium]
MTKIRLMIILLGLALVAHVATAQESVVMPDLTGMTVPVAAATLNRAGIGIGQETGERWTEESGLPRNTIGAQSVEPGTPVAPGSTVDLTVLRSPNVQVIYDDNDLTLVNETGGPIQLAGIMFRALDGNQASFAASRWGDRLRRDRCTQIWSLNRNGPKGLDECDYIEHWLTTTNGGEHFWTGAGGTSQFAILQNGIERAVCPVANPGRCEFYLPGGGSGGDATEHIYFAYTPDRLAVINNTEDRWMPLSGLRVLNNFAPTRGAEVEIANPSLFGGNLNPVANVQQLAPGQCIFFTNSAEGVDTPPQPCDVIARLDVGPSVIFWGADFPVESVTDDQPHTCPVATPGQLTLCIMPR